MPSIAELGIKVDSTDAAQASSDLDKLTAAGGRAEKAAEGVARGADKASKAIKSQADELADLLGEIDPTVKALGRLDELETKLSKHKGVGLDAATFSEYQAKIDQSRANLTRFDDSLSRTGNTAKQTAAALRTVPSQFTDIVTSLQGGQAPFSVLLQQGGQLKDSFGGVGAAAKAMGSYVLGLVNPFTLSAAAVGVLGAALLSSQSQFNEYNKAVISTGGVVGKTADQLSAFATTLADGRHFTEAGEAVLSLAQNGRLTGEVFQEVARAATETAAATGQSAASIADQLSSTKGKVTDLAVEYSNKYGVITQSTYDQIRALEEQGDRMGAIKTLSTAVADEMTRRNKEMEDSTRGLARAWNEVRTSISSAWNQLKTGLQASPELFRLQVLQGQLQDAQELGNQKLVAYYQQQIAAAQKVVDLQQQKAALTGQEESSRRQQIAGEDKWLADGLKYLTDQQKMEKEIAEARTQGLSSGRSQVEIEQRISDIRKSYEKKLSGPANQLDLTSFNDTQNQLKALTATYSNAQKDLDAQQKAGIISQESYAAQRAALIQAEKEEVTNAYQAEISALEATRDKTSTTPQQRIELDQKIADARTSMVKAQQDADTALSVLATNEEGRLNNAKAASEAYVAQLERQRAALGLQGDRAAASIGLSDRRQGLQSSLDSSTDRFNDERAKLLDRRKTAPDKYSQEDYEKDLASLTTAEGKYRDTVLSNYDKVTTAQSDWQSGASAAFQNYLESGRNVAGQMKTAFTNLFDGLTDSVVDWAFGADESFGDVLLSFGKMIAKMELQAAASSVFSGASNGSGGLLSTIGSSIFSSFTGGSPSSAGSTQAGYSSTYFPQGRATGGDVSPNTLYQVNENGPELYSQGGKTFLMTGESGGSVTPLTSGSPGLAAGGGGSSPIAVSIQISGDGTSQVSSNTSGMEQFGAEIGRFVEARYKQLEAKSLGPQGNIRKAINGRA
ncbi:phage tail length tape measure family protein [Pseudomonas sp. LS-2]|uniref:phage tail length tape measure family protein n=1 Tax=Pseudomonas sp. LS-2 TaxID=2315859 RepID=UPI000E72DD10|nr:phage tail length tape measure family protein [Pseudomonas sp. LS-2]RJX83498.1 phage tail tape measure protein [Pseudomonas sp. LS-2]